MPASPSLLLGARNSTGLYEHRIGMPDASVNGVALFIKSHRLAPAGISGQAMFRALFFAVRYQLINSIQVSAWVDDVPVVLDYMMVLPALTAIASKTVQVPLSMPVMYLGVERARTRPQGTWIQVQLRATSGSPFAVDGVEVEWVSTERRF